MVYRAKLPRRPLNQSPLSLPIVLAYNHPYSFITLPRRRLVSPSFYGVLATMGESEENGIYCNFVTEERVSRPNLVRLRWREEFSRLFIVLEEVPEKQGGAGQNNSAGQHHTTAQIDKIYPTRLPPPFRRPAFLPGIMCGCHQDVRLRRCPCSTSRCSH